MSMFLVEQPGPRISQSFESFYRITQWVIEHDTPSYWEYETTYVLIRSGHGQLTLNGRTYPVAPGTFCTLSPVFVYSFTVPPGESLVADVIVVPDAITAYMDSLPQNQIYANVPIDRLIPCCVLKGANLEKMRMAYDEYELESKLADDSSKYLMVCISQRIMYMYYMDILPSLGFCDDAPESLGSLILKHIFFSNPKDLSSISVAECFAIDQHRLNTELQQICGSSFTYVMHRAMVSGARELLLRDIPNKEIAMNCGFKSQSSFFRIFKSITGSSPEEYRCRLMELTGATRQKNIHVEVQRYVAENFQHPITIKDCSTALYLSPYAINKALEDFYGQGYSFHANLQKIRLLYARSLLVSTNMHVTDVAFYSGYSSVHSFIRHFKDMYSMTPKKYQMEAKKNDEKA